MSEKSKAVHGEEPIRRSRRGIPLWRKLLYSATVMVALFGILELLLWAFGVRVTLWDEDPFVGFSSHVPLFVASQNDDGVEVMVTAKNKRSFFNKQQFPREKPANTFRIVCLGGSTTFGRPYKDPTSFCGWLRELLPVADPTRRWEVINAGGISYASYRVAIVMEELARYEPDLFITYCGHNEFLEQRTYGELAAMPTQLRGLEALVSQTRTYSLMRRLLHGERALVIDGRSILPDEVDTILDSSIGPDGYTRDDEQAARIVAHYRFNLARMVRMANRAGAQVLLVQPAANLRDCSPFKSEHRSDLRGAELERWRGEYEAGRAALEAGRPADAVRVLDEAANVDDRHAETHYLHGRALEAVGQVALARQAYERARDEDVCALRATSPVLRALREVTVELSVPLVDFASLVDERAPDGIPGKNQFFDQVHPTIESHRLLALAIIDAMVNQGQLRPAPSWGEAEIARVVARVESEIDKEEHGGALRNLAQVLRWARKDEEAGALALEAAEMLPEDAEARYFAGHELWRQGRNQEAIAAFEAVVRIDARYYRAYNELGILEGEAGRLEEAIRHFERGLEIHPEFYEASLNLGATLERLGDTERAAAVYQDAIRSRPDLASPCYQLGKLLLRLGSTDRAVRVLRRGIEADPSHAGSHFELSGALARRGESAEAISSARRALELRPSWEAARRHLESLRERAVE